MQTASPRKLTVRFGYALLREDAVGAGTVREWAVEVRDRHTTVTVGRVVGSPGDWRGLPVVGQTWHGRAWSCQHTTRDAAAAAMLSGEDWQASRLPVPVAR
jgi:hypothetical protein